MAGPISPAVTWRIPSLRARELFADGAHHTRGRAVADGRKLRVLQDRLLVGGDCLQRALLLQDTGLPHGMLADREEDRPGAVRRKCREHRRRMARPGPVIERQHDLSRLQEVMALEVLEAETGPT